MPRKFSCARRRTRRSVFDAGLSQLGRVFLEVGEGAVVGVHDLGGDVAGGKKEGRISAGRYAWIFL